MNTSTTYQSGVLTAVDVFQSALGNLPLDLKPHECPQTDLGRTFLLRNMLDTGSLSFAKWDYDEVCVFLFCTYPRPLFSECCRIGGGSQFFNAVYENWQPSFEFYAYAVWEYTRRDAVLFGHWLFLLLDEQRPSKQEMGQVLFSKMVVSGMITESDCASVAGALILYPMENTYAREHEQEIDAYSICLEPCEVGLLCRSLFLHRAVERSMCKCNYRDGANVMAQCECGDSSVGGDMLTATFSDDMDKEYATVIFRRILERHHRDAVAYDRRWTQENRDDFLRSACEYVFGEKVYAEIYQKLHCGKNPRVEQRNPRPLTKGEIQTKAPEIDRNHDRIFSNKKGCVVPFCRQLTKKDCSNVSCRTHCLQLGYHNCKSHRFYCPKGGPSYLPRRGIVFLPDHIHNRGKT